MGRHLEVVRDVPVDEPERELVLVPDPPESAQSFAERNTAALKDLMHDLTVGNPFYGGHGA